MSTFRFSILHELFLILPWISLLPNLHLPLFFGWITIKIQENKIREVQEKPETLDRSNDVNPKATRTHNEKKTGQSVHK